MNKTKKSGKMANGLHGTKHKHMFSRTHYIMVLLSLREYAVTKAKKELLFSN